VEKGSWRKEKKAKADQGVNCSLYRELAVSVTNNVVHNMLSTFQHKLRLRENIGTLSGF